MLFFYIVGLLGALIVGAGIGALICFLIFKHHLEMQRADRIWRRLLKDLEKDRKREEAKKGQSASSDGEYPADLTSEALETV